MKSYRSRVSVDGDVLHSPWCKTECEALEWGVLFLDLARLYRKPGVHAMGLETREYTLCQDGTLAEVVPLPGVLNG